MTPDLTAYFSVTATLPPVLLISTLLVLRGGVPRLGMARQMGYGIVLVGFPMVAVTSSVLSLLTGSAALRWVVFALVAAQLWTACLAYARALFAGDTTPLA